jgi:hypothetical protein
VLRSPGTLLQFAGDVHFELMVLGLRFQTNIQATADQFLRPTPFPQHQ